MPPLSWKTYGLGLVLAGFNVCTGPTWGVHACFCVKQSRAPVVGVSWLQSVWINMQDWKPSGHFVLDRGGEVSERDGEGERVREETLTH